MKYAALLLVAISLPACAMKNRYEDFLQPCDAVWKASVEVAKRQEYRIVSISDEEHIISLAAGGFISGERMISLNVGPAPERGCRVTVQSRFSGLVHSDGPDLLGRIRVQVVGEEIGNESEAFLKFQTCVENSYSDAAKCEAKFRKRVASENQERPNNLPEKHTDGWWKANQPQQTEAQR
jgi:hypothetical protein